MWVDFFYYIHIYQPLRSGEWKKPLKITLPKNYSLTIHIYIKKIWHWITSKGDISLSTNQLTNQPNQISFLLHLKVENN